MTVFSPTAAWLPASLPPLRRNAVDTARSYLGVVEMPRGSNHSPQIDAWVAAVGSPSGSAWCAAFAAGVCKEIGAWVPSSSAGAVRIWHSEGIKAGLWKPTSYACVEGDLAVFDFEGTGEGDHMGFVVRLDTWLTIEGNTDVQGSRTGNGVFLQDRQKKGLLGYITLALAAA